MKKISCLFLVLLTLLCGCGVNNSNGYDAVDLSYEHICELSNFKCYASYLDQEITIEGEQAKELYKTVSESNTGIEHSPTSSQSNYIYLVFYNSTYNYPSADETTEFYGCYFIYSDGLLQFSGSPYHSAIFSLELKNSIFNDVFIGLNFPILLCLFLLQENLSCYKVIYHNNTCSNHFSYNIHPINW